MAGRHRKYRPPDGWQKNPKFRAEYEEFGRSFGRYYLWYPDKALKAWKMLAGCLGPKWKLEVFRFHWIKDNQEDYRVWKKQREIKSDRLKRQLKREAAAREEQERIKREQEEERRRGLGESLDD